MKTNSHSEQQNMAWRSPQPYQQLRTWRSACEVRLDGLPDTHQYAHVIPHDSKADLDCPLMACKPWNDVNLGWRLSLILSVFCFSLPSLSLNIACQPSTRDSTKSSTCGCSHNKSQCYCSSTGAPLSIRHCSMSCVLGVRDRPHSRASNIST